MQIDEAIAVVRRFHEMDGVKKEAPKAKGPLFKVGEWVKLDNKEIRYWSPEMKDMDKELAQVTKVTFDQWEKYFKYHIEGLEDYFFHELDLLSVDQEAAKAAQAYQIANRPTLSAAIITKLKGKDPGFATFGIRFKKKKDYIQIGDICHARMTWMGAVSKDEEMIEIRNWVKGYRNIGAVDKCKIYDDYLHYMLNDSPWAEASLTKDIAEAYKEGVLFDVNKNVSVLVGAAIAIREGWEHKSRMKLYGELRGKGVHGSVAYLVSACMGYRLDGGYSVHGINQGHMVLHDMMNYEALKRFFREGYQKDLPGIGKDKRQTSYQIFNTIIRCHNEDSYLGYREKDADKTVSAVFAKAIDAKVVGDGFNKRTVVDQGCVDRLVEFLTKELT